MEMQNRVKCFEEVEDEFFDSVDHMSAEHCPASNQVFGYEFWRNDLKSVKERRYTFLQEMGFIEPCSSSSEVDIVSADSDAEAGDDHFSESVSSSGFSSPIECQRECNNKGDRNVNESKEDHHHHHQVVNRPSLGDDDVSEDEEEVSTSNNCKSLNKKIRHWWKDLMKKQRRNEVVHTKFEVSRTKVEVNKKKFKEISALFAVQEIQAHEGVIWTMKFSPDSQYLATGGEDGVVRVWLIDSVVYSCLHKFPDKNFGHKRNKKVDISVVVPDKMFKIEELPVQQFHGHTADVLDLAWSNSNYLLSSSMDKTVRLWKVGSDTCLNTFHHTDYVTCVQFNPVNNRYFISGSIDGKVRVWGVTKHRVLDWADIRDAVTAVCYQPDGQAFVVGSVNGNCQFYETKGKLFELSAHVLLHGCKRSSSTNRITGIQFSSEDSQKVIVSSEDSKLCILDKMDVVSRFRGLNKSGSQMSATFTSNGSHIVSIGQDSRVYIWNHDKHEQSSSSHTKSNRSCEHFYSQGVSVAVPWCGTATPPKTSSNLLTNHEAASTPPNVNLSKLFSSKSSAILPEDMLPVYTQLEDHYCQGNDNVAHFSTWGLVVLAANTNGKITTYHNYGLPTRI